MSLSLRIMMRCCIADFNSHASLPLRVYFPFRTCFILFYFSYVKQKQVENTTHYHNSPYPMSLMVLGKI